MALSTTKQIKRANFIFLILLLAFIILIGRVWYWQFVRGDELRADAEKQVLRNTRVVADRGTIYDRNGKVIAQSASANTLVCSPRDIKEAGKAKEAVEKKLFRIIPIGKDESTAVPAFDNAAYVADTLAPIIDVERDELYAKMTKDNYYQVLKHRLSLEETEKINSLKDWRKYPGVEADKEEKDVSEEEWALIQAARKYARAEAAKFKGIYFEEDSKRYYSYNIAPHLLGFTDNDNKGRQGIEMKFDNELTGRAGSVIAAKSASGATMDFEYEERNASQKGADVILTIDETIQHFLEKHLENAVQESRLKEGAAGIIMNPKTGEILAMATKPDFDNNDPYNIEAYTDFMKKYGSDLTELEATPTPTPESSSDADENGEEEQEPKNTNIYDSDEAKQAIRYRMWRNKAISDTYEPGSTFKILTAAMALEENVVNLNSPFYCSGSLHVGDRNIGCHKIVGHGSETFLQGVQNSCNPVFMELGMRLGGEKFMEYFKAFGLTEKTGIDLMGESSGLYYTTKMSDLDVATSAFGQGNNVTPIQLITAISAVINGGELMKPQIIKEIRNENGVIKSYEPEVRNRVISRETSDTMREILESVVGSPNGTGKNAYIKGYRIGGKTGTSEKGIRDSGKRIASFVGFAPADDPEIICLIMLDEPQVEVKYGGTIAAPVVGSIIEETLAYLGVERQFTESELEQMNIAVPELRGMKVDEAKPMLENENMYAKVQGDGDEVVDQLPKPGSAITKNSTVILYTEEVDIGDTVTVPDVTGMSLNAARNTLRNAGLNFEIIGAGYNSSDGAHAAKQSIAAGEKVAPATVIGVEFRHVSSD